MVEKYHVTVYRDLQTTKTPPAWIYQTGGESVSTVLTGPIRAILGLRLDPTGRSDA